MANTASINAIKQFVKVHGKDAESSAGELTLTMSDFEEALKETRKGPQRESPHDRPEIR
jgi:hypothetical protein